MNRATMVYQTVVQFCNNAMPKLCYTPLGTDARPPMSPPLMNFLQHTSPHCDEKCTHVKSTLLIHALKKSNMPKKGAHCKFEDCKLYGMENRSCLSDIADGQAHRSTDI